ncbi:MAG: glycosyltransferase [Acidobacteriota bacterium]
MIRILYVVGSLEVGGAERQLVELCTRLDRRIFDPRVVTLGPPGPLAAEIRSAGGTVISLRSSRRNAAGAKDPRRALSAVRGVWRLRRIISEFRPAVVHAFLTEAAVVAAAASRGARAPALIVAKRSLVRSISAMPFFFPLVAFANRRAQRIHVNSRAVGEDVIAREGADPDRIQLIYNGVDTNRFFPPAARPWRPERRVGMMANFIPYKGHVDVLAAFARVSARVPGLQLHLFGRPGPSSETVRAAVESSGLASRVHFRGLAANPAEALRELDVLVSASHEEGFSNAILEAMSTGLPIVATSVGGSVEQLEDRVSGMLVPPDRPEALEQALERILRDDKFAERIGAAARQRVLSQFSVEKMVEQTARMYQDVAG